MTDVDKKLDQLFAKDDSENIFANQNKKIVSLIDNLRIVDPAVGSGAFPMRILNKLVFILSKIDPKNELWKEAQIEAIRNNISDPTLKKQLIEQTEQQFENKNFDYGENFI